MQVGLHKLKGDIQVPIILGPNYPVQFDHVGMVQLPEYAYLPIGALRICGILEGIENLLECEWSFGGAFYYLPDVSICATAQQFLWLVELKQVLFDLLAHLSKSPPIDIITQTALKFIHLTARVCRVIYHQRGSHAQSSSRSLS